MNKAQSIGAKNTVLAATFNTRKSLLLLWFATWLVALRTAASRRCTAKNCSVRFRVHATAGEMPASGLPAGPCISKRLVQIPPQAPQRTSINRQLTTLVRLPGPSTKTASSSASSAAPVRRGTAIASASCAMRVPEATCMQARTHGAGSSWPLERCMACICAARKSTQSMGLKLNTGSVDSSVRRRLDGSPAPGCLSLWRSMTSRACATKYGPARQLMQHISVVMGANSKPIAVV
mmetsp:Transcript_28697/g.78941  ORF Transcript_28697/g.78941 Transcript_28697/m.78941 type:complete len:235 (-) Transcript_28697:333-1037(-)